jgi:hypothetical protein
MVFGFNSEKKLGEADGWSVGAGDWVFNEEGNH